MSENRQHSTTGEEEQSTSTHSDLPQGTIIGYKDWDMRLCHNMIRHDVR